MKEAEPDADADNVPNLAQGEADDDHEPSQKELDDEMANAEKDTEADNIPIQPQPEDTQQQAQAIQAAVQSDAVSEEEPAADPEAAAADAAAAKEAPPSEEDDKTGAAKE